MTRISCRRPGWSRCWRWPSLGLAALVRPNVQVGGRAGVNADLKAGCLVAEMAAGADSIDDMDRLRHGAMSRLFSDVRAPSTLGSFLRSFTHGHVKQLHAVARRFLPELARHTPLLSGADQVAYVDIDDTIRNVRIRQAGRRLRIQQVRTLSRA